MATYPVKWFTSDMRDAPVLSGTAGTLIAMLDACLVTGFGVVTATSVTVSGGVATATLPSSSLFLKDAVVLVAGATSLTELNGEQRVLSGSSTQVTWATTAADGTAAGTITIKYAPLGAWTKVYSGTNLAVYRSTDPQSNGHYLRVDDTGTTSARVRGYEEMTDVNTGTGPFCTDTQMSGGGYWWKSASANTNASKWKLFGDSRFFSVAVAAASSSSTVNIAAPAKGFGDALALAPGGDAWNTVLSANGNNSSNSAPYGALDNSSVSATLGFVVSTRSWTGLGSAVLLNSLPYIGATNAVSGADATLGIVPSEIDGRIKPTRRFLSEQGTNKPPRSEIPGVMSIPQTGALSILNDGDMLAGADDLSGRQLMCVATGSSYTSAPTGIYLVDITGPWRS